MSGSRIIGTGSYLPRTLIKSEDMPGELLPYSEQLQEFFSGVKTRHHSAEDETNVMMGAESSRKALARAKLSPMDIDLMLSFSMFTDYTTPRDVSFIAHEIGAYNAACWHMDTACASFVSMMNCADAMLKSGRYKRAMLVLPTNWVNRGFESDRDHRCLGDGSSTVILEASADEHLLAVSEHTDSVHADKILMYNPVVTKKQEFVIFKRNEEAKNYYKRGMQLVREMMADSMIFPNDIDWFICHQPGLKMIDLYCHDLEIERSKNLSSVEFTGHLWATDLAFLIDYYVHVEPKIKRGDKILFYSPGSGTHFAAMIYQY